METLTPELERRLQIEELWARRLVLCEAINQARLDRYHGRRALLCLNRADAEPAALQASQPETTKRAAALVEKPASGKAPQRARSALVQGLCGAAAAALIIVGAMIEDPQASIIRAQSFVASLVHPWGTAPQVRSEDQANLDEDTADTPPSFPDLHREVSQKLPHPLPAGANSR